MSLATLAEPHATPRAGDVRAAAADIACGAIVFAGAAIGGFSLFVLLLRIGVFGSIDILFYRGIAVAIITSLGVMAAVVALASYSPRWTSLRDAVAAAALVFGLNISILTVVPVTIDRSISIFLLGHMDENSDRAFTAGELDATFRDVYLTKLAQIERRMLEQKATGHVERVGDGWRITAQGRGFVTTAKRLGTLFDVDTQLLTPSRISGPPRPAATDR